jgi:hypothetical protein
LAFRSPKGCTAGTGASDHPYIVEDLPRIREPARRLLHDRPAQPAAHLRADLNANAADWHFQTDIPIARS